MSLRAVVMTLAVLATSACPGPAFRDAAPAERPASVEGNLDNALLEPSRGGASNVDTRAFPRPELEFYPADALGRDPVSFEVVGHFRAGPSSRVALRGPDQRVVELRYRVANGLRLPLAVEDEVVLSRWGDGLVVRERSGALRFVVAIDPPATSDERLRALADAVQPAFVADRMVYSELSAAATGCVASVDHHALEVRLPVVDQPDTRSFLAPGRALRVRLTSEGADEAQGILLALDASRATPRRAVALDPAPRCGAPPHVSWLLVSAAATTTAPTPSPRP